MSDVQKIKKDKSQLDKFKEAERELECDDNETRFKDRLGKLVRANHPKEKQI